MYWNSPYWSRRWRGWGWGWRRGKGWGWGRGIFGPVSPQVMPTTVPPGTIPLERVPPGTKVKVVAILTGLGASSRAYQMGIAPGTILEVVENNLTYPWTPLIVSVHGIQVAIGRGLASRIFVEQITPTTSQGTTQQTTQDENQ